MLPPQMRLHAVGTNLQHARVQARQLRNCGVVLTLGLCIAGVRRELTSCGAVSQLSGSRAAHRRLTCALLMASTSAGTSSTICNIKQYFLKRGGSAVDACVRWVLCQAG